MKNKNVKISKFLSYVLRHNPQAIGLALDEGGWAWVDDLIQCAAKKGKSLNPELIQEIVATNDKQRFALSEDNTRIRATQGHSLPVDLGLKPMNPPSMLFHGTASRFLDSILRTGLLPRNRQYVHLSLDRQTATQVGQRHGIPIILAIDSDAMHQDGYPFFLSQNGIWMTKEVPPKYLKMLDKKDGT